MQKQQTSILKRSLLVSALGLSACGGSGGDSSAASTEQPAKPLVSSFSSSLTLQDEGQPVQVIASRTTTEGKDSTLAYSISTTLSNSRIVNNSDKFAAISFPQTNQTLSFQLNPVKNSMVLEVTYDPFTQQPEQITLIKNKGNNASNFFSCYLKQTHISESQPKCTDISANYRADTGKLSIAFKNTVLYNVVNITPETIRITLNGQLVGELSIAPLTIKDIPQTSSGNIIVNGKVQKILAASNSISILGHPRTAVTALLEDGSGIYFGKNLSGDYESGYILPERLDVIAEPENIGLLSHQNTAQSDAFQLSTSRFNFSAPVRGETPTPINMSGTLTMLKPTQALNHAPVIPVGEDKNGYWYNSNSPLRYSFIPESIRITLINHNQVMLEEGNFQVVINNRKLQYIRYKTLLDSNLNLQSIDYSCGNNTTACQGATVTANGFGLQFNNTLLANNGNIVNTGQPAAIQLNGGLVYLGR